MNLSILEVLMTRDNMSKEDAMEMIQEACERISQGEDPIEILHEDFGLEPDYVYDLLK